MYQAIVFMPLVGFVLAGCFSRSLGTKACEYITTTLVIVSALLSWFAFSSFGVFSDAAPTSVAVARWISVGDLNANWALRIDTLSVVMMALVTSVSALVHFFSIGFMRQDAHRPRFFAYLSLSTFAMLALVTSDNLVQMLFGWQMIGLATYLLVGFWYRKPTATSAATQVFVINRIGDLGFMLGIFGVFYLFNTVEFEAIFANVAGIAASETLTMPFFGNELAANSAITLICLALLIGAAAKSAQLLLHTWISETIEGPVPASALIYAATLVPSGGFLIARMSPLFEYSPTALSALMIWGGLTAIFAAATGLVQTNIRRVVAYTVCCQMGFVFAALGAGAYGAAVFHIFSSAMFTALLFLGAGSVIHALTGESDMRRMGGLKKNMPATYWTMVIGVVGVMGIGVPGTLMGTSGFASQNAIFASLSVSELGASMAVLTMLLFAAFLSSLFVWRMLFIVFHGRTRAYEDVEDHIHEPPNTMRIPIYLLAGGLLLAGVFFSTYFVGFESGGSNEQWYNAFWREALFATSQNTVLADFKEAATWVVWAPVIASLLGFLMAWLIYSRYTNTASEIAKQHSGLHQLLVNRWYFEEFYSFLFVYPVKWLGRTFWKKGDHWLIDGFGPNWISDRVLGITGRVVKLQSGFIYHYALAMMVGIIVIVALVMTSGAN